METVLSCIFYEKPKKSQIFFLEELPIESFHEVVFLVDTFSQRFIEKYLQTFPKTKLIVIPLGECYKTEETKQLIEEQLFKNKCSKQTTLIGVGGGVVCDLAGYVAATYLRGIDLILIPTTLLAMVDAAFGGKNGVNTAFGKNLLGSFYPACEIWIDLQTRDSWKMSHLQEGMAEMIKKALIADPKFFMLLENHTDLFLSKDLLFLKQCIKKSLMIKASYVQSDLLDSGLRRCLNFGHTIAHALESCSNYAISHGHAVAIGLCVETWISGQFYSEALLLVPIIIELLKKLQFPFLMPEIVTKEKLLKACSFDKKNSNAEARFVILKKLGEVESFGSNYCTTIPDKLLEESIEWMLEIFKEKAYVD